MKTEGDRRYTLVKLLSLLNPKECTKDVLKIIISIFISIDVSLGKAIEEWMTLHSASKQSTKSIARLSQSLHVPFEFQINSVTSVPELRSLDETLPVQFIRHNRADQRVETIERIQECVVPLVICQGDIILLNTLYPRQKWWRVEE